MPVYEANLGGPGSAWLPQEAGELVIQPVTRDSIAIQAAGSIRAGEQVASYALPVVTGDPTAAWLGEGDTITPSNMTAESVSSPFFKLGGLTIASREAIDDSDPAIAEQIGAGLSRDIVRRLDDAFFGSRGVSTVAPPGLEDLEDVHEIFTGGTAWTSVDAFTEAAYAALDVGVALNAFVAHPSDGLALSQLKEQTGSQKALLTPDPTAPARQMIGGVPLLVSSAVTPGIIWGIPGGGRVVIVVRNDVRIETSIHTRFGTDEVAIRALMRVAVLYPHEAAVIKINLAEDPEG